MDNQNLAKLSKEEIIDHVKCQECLKDYLFKMKDNYHEFYISLRDVMTCFWLAEKEGLLPPIDDEWYYKVANQYL